MVSKISGPPAKKSVRVKRQAQNESAMILCSKLRNLDAHLGKRGFVALSCEVWPYLRHTQGSASDELILAIRKVSLGRKYVSASLAEKLAFELEGDTERPLHETLSDREYQVMCMIAGGKQVKQIAEELYLSIKTISTYRSRILEKMGVKNNAELTYYVIKNQLID